MHFSIFSCLVCFQSSKVMDEKQFANAANYNFKLETRSIFDGLFNSYCD